MLNLLICADESPQFALQAPFLSLAAAAGSLLEAALRRPWPRLREGTLFESSFSQSFATSTDFAQVWRLGFGVGTDSNSIPLAESAK